MQENENENINNSDNEQPKTHAKGMRKTKVSNGALYHLEQCTNTENVQRHPKNLTFSQEMSLLTITSRSYGHGGNATSQTVHQNIASFLLMAHTLCWDMSTLRSGQLLW
jgi:hypothetical protein